MAPTRRSTYVRGRFGGQAAALAVLLAVLSSSGAALGLADEPLPAQVEELIRRGNDLRRDGKDHAAVPLFQQAYDLERSPRTAAQLGLVESALGYWMAAERHLAEALAFPRHPWMLRNRALIEKAMAHVQTYIAEIEVTGSPEGAELLVNGRPAGKLPLPQPVRAPEGVLQLVLRAPGYESATRSVRVSGGKNEAVRLTLERAKTPATAVPTTPPGEGAATPRQPDEAPLGMSSRQRGRSAGAPAWVRPAAWSAAAASVVALSVGTYGVLRQRSKRDQFDQYRGPAMEQCSTSAPMRGGADCPTLYEEAQSAANLAIMGFVAGGVLAGAAITGFLLSAGGDEASDEGGADGLAWRVSLAPGAAQVSYSLRF